MGVRAKNLTAIGNKVTGKGYDETKIKVVSDSVSNIVVVQVLPALWIFLLKLYIVLRRVHFHPVV